MPVYFIQSGGEFGPVKIGVASDVGKRLKNMQTGSRETLRILRVFEGAKKEEQDLHARFASARLAGEWFAFRSQMLHGDFGLRELFASVERRRGPRRKSIGPLGKYLDDNDLTLAAFAARIGTSLQAVQRYATGGRLPRKAIMQRIVVATGSQIQPNDFFSKEKEKAA